MPFTFRVDLTPANLIYKFPLTRVQRFLSMVILGPNKLIVGVNITEVLEVGIKVKQKKNN